MRNSRRACLKQEGFRVEPTMKFRNPEATERIYDALIGPVLLGDDPRDLPKDELKFRALDNMVALFRSILVNKVIFTFMGHSAWDVVAQQVGLYNGARLSGADARDLIRFMGAARESFHTAVHPREEGIPREWFTFELGAELVALVDEYMRLREEDRSLYDV